MGCGGSQRNLLCLPTTTRASNNQCHYCKDEFLCTAFGWGSGGQRTTCRACGESVHRTCCHSLSADESRYNDPTSGVVYAPTCKRCSGEWVSGGCKTSHLRHTRKCEHFVVFTVGDRVEGFQNEHNTYGG